MWAGDGASLFFVSDRGGAENIWQTATSPAGPPRQLTRFTDGRVLWPSITARGDVDRVRAQLPDLEARHRQRRTSASVDRADWRAGRARGRAPAPDQPVPGPRALARRQEGRVRGARRDLRRVGEGRRRRGARHHDAGRGSRSSPGRPTAAASSTRRSATARAPGRSTTSRPARRRRSPPRRAATTRRGSRPTASRSRSCAAAPSCASSTSRPGRSGCSRKASSPIRSASAVPSPGRPTAAGSRTSPPARAASPTCRSSPPPAASRSQVSFLANANANGDRLVARRHVPAVRHRPAHRSRRSSRASI